MGFYLGLDVGGSRSRWAWLDREPRERPWGIQAAVRGTEEAVRALARLIAEIRECDADRSPDLAVIGMAGAGERETACGIEDGLRRSGVPWALRVVGDVLVAAAAALADGPGVALWSGTGSFAVGRDSTGALHRVGGRGHLLGDSGSAYDMVRCAGVAAARSLDGLGPRTGLLEVLVGLSGAPSPTRLGPAMQRFSAEQVAGCFPAIASTAEAGDEVARAVLRRGANHLARLALTAARRSGLDPETAPVFAGGGVLESGGLLFELLREELEGAGLDSDPKVVIGGAARGGAVVAKALHQGDEPMRSWVEAGVPA